MKLGAEGSKEPDPVLRENKNTALGAPGDPPLGTPEDLPLGDPEVHVFELPEPPVFRGLPRR